MKTQQPSLRCVNCGIRVPQNSRVAKDQSLDIQDLLNQWILPKEITDTDHICTRCHDCLLQALELPEEARTRQLGHKYVCVMCGRSLLKIRSRPVFQPGQSMEQWVQRARVISTVLTDYTIKVDDKACINCIEVIDSKCPRRPTDPKPAKIPEQNTSNNDSEVTKPETSTEDNCIAPEITIKVEMPDPPEDEDGSSNKTDMNDHDGYIPNENLSCELKIEFEPDDSINESVHSTDVKEDAVESQDVDEEDDRTHDNYVEVGEITQDYTDIGTIALPNIRRAGASSNQCLFRGCKNKTRHHIPRHVRTTIMRDHKYFIASKCRVCLEHLERNSYEELYNTRYLYRNNNIFTAAHLEEMIDLLVPKSSEHLMDYEHASHMPEYLLEYWTGIPTKMFMEILNITGLWHQDSMFLVALLCKLRTEDSNERVAKIFRTCRKSFERKLLVVRKALIDHSECINMISSTIYNKRKKKVYLDYFLDQPEPTEEQMMNRIKWERRKMLAAAKESGAIPPKPTEPKANKSKKTPKKANSKQAKPKSSSSAQLKTKSNLDETQSEQGNNTPSLLQQWSSMLQSNASAIQPVPCESKPASVNAPTLLDQWNSTSIQLNQLSTQLKNIPTMLNQWNNSNIKVTPTLLLRKMNIPKSSIIEVEFPKLIKAEKRSYDEAMPQENSETSDPNEPVTSKGTLAADGVQSDSITDECDTPVKRKRETLNDTSGES